MHPSSKVCWPPEKKLNSAQVRFVLACEQYEIIFAVGGVGSGKSTIVFDVLLERIMNTPGGVFLVGRRTYRELDDITIPKYLEWLGPLLLSYQGGDSRTARVQTRYPDKPATLLFRFLDEPDKLGSMEIADAVIEEAQELTDDEAPKALLKRMRGAFTRRLFIVANPPTYRHWIYKWAVVDNRSNVTIIHFSSYDNKEALEAKSPGYLKSLEEGLPEEEKQVALGGYFRIVGEEGVPAYRSLFKMSQIQTKPYNPNLPLWRGWDFGFNNAFCVIAQGSADPPWLHVLAEVHSQETTTAVLADRVLAVTKLRFPNQVIYDFCDPAGVARQSGSGESDIAVLKHKGIRAKFKRSKPKDRMRLLQYLAMLGVLTVDPQAAPVLRDGLQGGLRIDPDTDILIKDGWFDHPHDALGYMMTHIFKWDASWRRSVEEILKGKAVRGIIPESNKNNWEREEEKPKWGTLQEVEETLSIKQKSYNNYKPDCDVTGY